jgi:pimeloyl-ACP methyl ester carboxylesterase
MFRRAENLLLAILVFMAGCGGGPGSNAPIAPQPPVEAIVTGAQLVRSLGDIALVGQSYRSQVGVLPNDGRNGVVALTITNPTAGGATPTIDASGAVAWTPNEADFTSTRELTITATLREGAAATLTSPVAVRKEQLVHEQQLPAAAGTIADLKGRYLIQVEPEAVGTSMTGALSISEVFSSNGSLVYVVRVPVTSGARVTVLDAPRALAVAPVGGTSVSTGAARATIASGRKMALAKESAEGLTGNRGELINPALTGNGYMANRGEVNVYTTRDAGFHYARRVGGLQEYWSPEATAIYQIDANCWTAVDCTSALRTRGPVILIHGFTLGQSVGGGDGTWGSLASTLAARGHPVFELRWNTYMRFEEAAGILSTLSKRVAELTGQRVTVVAHSFGGVVAHLSMMGQGIQHQGDAWYRVPVVGVYQRLITLGSPLSGIRQVVAEPYGLTAGRDDDDQSIAACEAITCFQGGSSAAWGPEEVGEMTAKLTAIDPDRLGLGGDPPREGGTIRTLHAAWRASTGHAVPFSTVVSLKKRPIDDYVPDLTNETAFDLGDGLISMMGQAVLPTHFSANPFETNKRFDILGTLGADFLTRLDARFAVPMERVSRDGFEYFFALRAAHSCAQRGAASDCFVWSTSDAYLVAYYPKDGLVDLPGVGTGSAYHPLRFFIESPAHLAEPRTAYSGTPPMPFSVVRGTLTRDGQPLPGENVSFQIENATTGQFVTGAEVRRSDINGGVVFDAGQALATRFPGQSLNVANFNVRVGAGTGLSTARVFFRQTLAAEVELGNIDFTQAPVNALVAIGGRVIDGQTESQAIPEVQLFLMKGLNQSQTLLQSVADTTTSRRVTTDAGGNFFITGLEPGIYSVLAVRVGYVSQTQGVVTILAGGDTLGLSFSLLRVLATNQTTITLRWLANNGDVRISPDLDAWMFKFNSAGVQEYLISYYSRVGTGGDQLDRDDRTYQGPETISFTVDSSARYLYYVGNYEYWRLISTLGGSQPSVSVRIGETERQFSLPPGLISSKQYWRVFEVVNGVVVPCEVNCLVDGSGTTSPGK